MSIRDRAAPVMEIQPGPLSLVVEIDARDADWLVAQARMLGVTPEAVVEQLVVAAAQKSRKPG